MASKPLLVGISGPSSSGKTTLSRLLRDILPKTLILHEDDFYKSDKDIPVKNGVADWDCLDSLNLPSLLAALKHLAAHGRLPEGSTSKEDQNSVGPTPVSDDVVQKLKDGAKRFVDQRTPVVVVDGFLLFGEAMPEIRDMFEVKLFLRTDYKTAKTRREARTGYVTLEGFWEDPPGYVDQVVWPNYVADHAFLFQDGNVEGQIKEDVKHRLGIEVMPDEAQGNMTKCLEWAYGVLADTLEKRRTSTD